MLEIDGLPAPMLQLPAILNSKKDKSSAAVHNGQEEANSRKNEGSRREGSRGRVTGGATRRSSSSSLPLGHRVPWCCFSLSLNSRSRIVEASVPEAHLFRASRASLTIATTDSTRTLPRSYSREPSPTTAGGGGGGRILAWG